MPTICSSCGRTSGKCESCRKVDAAIAAHEVPAAGRRMYEAVKKVMDVKPAPARGCAMGSEEFRMKLAAIAAECEDAGTVAEIDRLLESTSPTQSQDGMPPLPEPRAIRFECSPPYRLDYYTADDLHAYGQQCADQARQLSTPSAVAAEDARFPTDWRNTIQGAIDELPYAHYLIPRLVQLLATPHPAPAVAEPIDSAAFWAGVYTPVGMTAEQVRNELNDYRFLLEQVPLVYEHVTGGLLSKTNCYASTVIAAADDHVTELCEEADVVPAVAEPKTEALLVRDVASFFDVEPLVICVALRTLGFGEFSINTGVSAGMVRELQKFFEAKPAVAAEAGQELTDDALRAMWRDAGGQFHGPIVETGTMPESKLLLLLRSLFGKRAPVAHFINTAAEGQRPYYEQVADEYIGTQGVVALFATQPAPPSQGRMAEHIRPRALRDVITERRRQISVEGWTPEHDDEHTDGSLAEAAACYALGDVEVSADNESVPLWPWDLRWFKPDGARRNLVKAGALILAEIERLDRAAPTQPPAEGEQV